MGEGGERREEGSGMSMVLPVVRSKMGFRLVLGALCVGAVVGLSLAVALPATQAAEQVSSQVNIVKHDHNAHHAHKDQSIHSLGPESSPTGHSCLPQQSGIFWLALLPHVPRVPTRTSLDLPFLCVVTLDCRLRSVSTPPSVLSWS